MNPASIPPSDRVRMVVCTPNPVSPPVIAALVKQMQAQQSIDFERVAMPEEIASSVEKSAQGLVICTLVEKEELLGILNFLAKHEARLQSGTLRVLIISKMNHPKVYGILRAKGVTEILDYNVAIKALNLKIKNALLIAHQSLLKAKKGGAKDRGGMDGLSGGVGRAKADTLGEVIWGKPFEHACDFWLVTNKKNVRFVMGRWLVDVFGPGPSAGTWESCDIQFKGEVGWKWTPRLSTDLTFQRESGHWIFFGRAPEFVWAKNSWAFVGKFARLAFYRDGETLFERFGPDAKAPGKLHVSENSENAKGMAPKIQETLEASVRLADGKETNELSMPNSPDAARPGFSADLGGATRATMMDPSFLNRRADVQALSFMKPGGAPAGAWNDHLGATGVAFNAKNHQMPTRGVGRWGGNNLLTPNEAGLDMGFGDLGAAGIKIDASAFESIDLRIALVSKLKTRLSRSETVGLLDLTDGNALFDAPAGFAGVGDELGFEAVLTIGDRKTRIEVTGYASKSEDFEDGRGLLICRFEKEQADGLQAVLKVFQDRQIELTHFFRMAKGA